jgi:cell division protein FtsN
VADRDFAKLQAAARPPVAGMSRLRTASLVVAIVTVVIGGFVGGYWLGKRQGHETAESEARAALVAQIQEQKQELAVLRRQQAEDKAKAKADVGVLPNTDVGDLTFYTDLPKQPVKPEPLSQPVSKPTMTAAGTAAVAAAAAAAKPAQPAHTPAQPAATPAAPAPGSGKVQAVIRRALAGRAAATQGYYVQVASFRDTQSAARVRAKLTAIGLDSALKPARIPGRGTWYRLQVGPYGSQHDAEAVRIDIEQKMRIKGLIVHEGG